MKWNFNKVMLLIYGIASIVGIFLFLYSVSHFLLSKTMEMGFLTTWLLLIFFNIKEDCKNEDS